MGMPAVVDPHLQKEFEQFLFREADLLDTRRFDDWLALFAEDATYLSPIVPVQQVPRAVPEN
ncbi:aromatic-ring-hydroxylating dioxygenase subunit beta, partial [Neisseria sp. P0008.S010]|uniref:aromatic-ring-hydroxylating dioxygenase subunit beta n=1 Tax=Neisseria sp. P0008.S010 TaxID=3436707 RepID=UPI003F7E5109